MADFKVVDAEQLESDLTVVADAIREKGGTSEQLEFPNGMADAVRGIQSGGSVETWTTLYDVTLEEDVNKVLVTTDMNGNPYKAKKLRLTFLGTVTDARLNMSFGGAMQKTYLYQAFSADKYVRSIVEIGEQMYNGMCLTEAKVSSEKNENAYTLACSRYSAISGRPLPFIESVSLGLQTDKYYTAGTRVIIEGVLES